MVLWHFTFRYGLNEYKWELNILYSCPCGGCRTPTSTTPTLKNGGARARTGSMAVGCARVVIDHCSIYRAGLDEASKAQRYGTPADCSVRIEQFLNGYM